MLAQMIREMEEAIGAARQQAAAVVASERRLWRELERTRVSAAAWKTRARLALDHEREDLARRALARHFEQLDLAQSLEVQHAAARQSSAEVQTAVQALEDRLSTPGDSNVSSMPASRRCMFRRRLRPRGERAISGLPSRASRGWKTDWPSYRTTCLSTQLLPVRVNSSNAN